MKLFGHTYPLIILTNQGKKVNENIEGQGYFPVEKYHAINASVRVVFFACVMTQAVLAIFEDHLEKK